MWNSAEKASEAEKLTLKNAGENIAYLEEPGGNMKGHNDVDKRYRSSTV